METKEIISKKTVLTIILCTLLSFFSCTVEDDVIEPEVKESFKVKAAAMLADNIPSNEVGALEIYGKISAVLVLDPYAKPEIPLPSDSGEELVLWTRSSSNFESVGSAETVINSEGSEQTFTVTEEQINNGARILIYTKLWDNDPPGNPDDYLGETFLPFGTATIRSRNEPILQQLSFTAGGLDNLVTLRVRFILEYLGEE
ncbi:hypothetical protein [Ascidiimonas sp. W6]|uniref:hypothetical protein n=1 Tax=Ascidiimonas meishanensis TaxID=3128903 RepID=UPI0030ED2996